MNKAFTKESESEDDDDGPSLPALPAGGKNYITPQGHDRLRAELLLLRGDLHLLRVNHLLLRINDVFQAVELVAQFGRDNL